MARTSSTPHPDSPRARPRTAQLLAESEHPCPLVIAHRGGRGDHPENTLAAIRGALAVGADMLWLSVQVSRDGVPVLYRPLDLGELTDGSGPVEAHTAEQLARLNAGYHFAGCDGRFPYRRSSAAQLPSLAAALRVVPAHVPVLLDLKSPHVAVLAPAIAAVLDTPTAEGTTGWGRVRFYSTQREATETMSAFPLAHCFEPRDTTRDRLMLCRLTRQRPAPPAPGTWAGFELHRKVELTEEFTLGTGASCIPDATFWDERSVDCFRGDGGVTLVFFGVNTPEDYLTAWHLGADAVMADSPRRMVQIRADLARMVERRGSAPGLGTPAARLVGASSRTSAGSQLAANR
ncbi:glycerophosphodiester phosphodiesterase family protein [Streptacidiphilus rugosus]|uniref:glycerophosphodiester phosphodiesterase family protein n=1 Tax=Streptacidiphilus rugosus TaxID=405783 RepID=UPI0006913F35|nr:glycerophosphodiester phosphodiesterase family protein [Streptacidiphilus rugosus]